MNVREATLDKGRILRLVGGKSLGCTTRMHSQHHDTTLASSQAPDLSSAMEVYYHFLKDRIPSKPTIYSAQVFAFRGSSQFGGSINKHTMHQS